MTYENYDNQGVYVSDKNGEHTFATVEEYIAYRNEQFDKLPIICDTCIYHLQENKKKFKCPLDRYSKSPGAIDMREGNCKQCSYYWKNPETLKDWKNWYKRGFLSRYHYYKNKIERKFCIGFYRSYRKFFIYGPSLKHPYFMIVHRTRNEYENECNIYNIGWISEEHSYYKKATLFEKFFYMQYHFPTEHINYEYAECTSDYYVHMFNNIKSNDSYFKCHTGELYQVRHIAKYKYYDILYNKKPEDEYELTLKGQIVEEDFNKHFRIPTHEELMELLKKRNEDKNKETSEEKTN